MPQLIPRPEPSPLRRIGAALILVLAGFVPDAPRARGATPALEIQTAAPGVVEIGWAATSTAVLETALGVGAPGLWSRVAEVPVRRGDQWVVRWEIPDRTRFFRLRGDSSDDEVVLRLANDTGVSATDAVTRDPGLLGHVARPAALTDLRLSIRGSAGAKEASVREQVRVDGGFTLELTTLETVYGGLLTDGGYLVELRAMGTGAQEIGRAELSFVLDSVPPAWVLSPQPGQQEVLPTQLVVLSFTESVQVLDDRAGAPTTDLTGVVVVTAEAQEVPGRVVRDETGMRLTFVPAEVLPGGTEFQVSVAASRIVDRAGNAAFASREILAFRTANARGLPETSLVGWVFDTERNEEGAESPLVGARVSVVGASGATATTDEHGRFVLEGLPAGRVLLEADGSTVRAPAGYFYPTVTKLFDAVAGRGFIIEAPIYLPRVPVAAFVSLSTNTVTSVANAAQLSGWSLAVPPNSIQRRDGTGAGRVSISPVPPARLPAPLPAGLDPSLVITIQTEGGAEVFTQPVPLTAPNLEGLAPGQKTVLWDFDHGRGEFVPVALATVSADGSTVTTDTGQGVLRPGWHFIRNVMQAYWDVLNGEDPKPGLDPVSRDLLRKDLAKLALSAAALAGDFSFLAPGPVGLGLTAAGAAAGAARGLFAGPGTAAGSVVSSIGGSLVGDAGGQLLTAQADGYARAALDASSGKLARDNAYKALGRGATGIGLRAMGGLVAGLQIPDDFNRLTGDFDQVVADLEDPPGDRVDQIRRAIGTARSLGSDLSQDIYRAAALGFEAMEKVTRILIVVSPLPPEAPLNAAQAASLYPLADVATRNFEEAAALVRGLEPKFAAARASLEALQALLAPPTTERVYYRFGAAFGGGTSASGTAFAGITLSAVPGTTGTLTVAEPIRGAFAQVPVVFPPLTGDNFFVRMPPILLYPSRQPDANGNGLADDLDTVLGSPSRGQVNALRNGLPPSEAGLATLGLLGRLASGGYADLVPGDRVVYGLGGTNALEVIDVSRPNVPVKVGWLTGPTPTRGTLRGDRLATVGFGVRLYDVADPRAPRLIREMAASGPALDSVNPVLGANHLVVARGLGLICFDLDTGLETSRLTLAGVGTPQRLELIHETLYVLTADGLPDPRFALTTVRLDSEGRLTRLGEVRPFFWSTASLPRPVGLAVDDRAAFVGGWLYSLEPFAPGFGAIDIQRPEAPVVVGTPSTNVITGAGSLAVDNAGHLLATVFGTQQSQFLEVYDVRELGRTDNRVLSLPLPEPAYAPGFSGGLAVFAAGAELFLARVVPLDAGNRAPVIEDVVVQGGGGVITEGRHLGVHVRVTDDTQVARVELLLQGTRLVASDATYPFDLDFLPPAGLPDGQAMTLTVRATDTGGNSSEHVVNLNYRARSPRVVEVSPASGFTTKLGLEGGSVRFDKAMDPAGVNAGFLDLRASGPDGNFGTADDRVVTLVAVQFDARNTRLDLDFGAPLPVGRYRLTLNAAKFRDPGGNPLDGEFSGILPSGNGAPGGDFATEFEVLAAPKFAVAAIPFRGFATDARSYVGLSIQSVATPLLSVDVNRDGRVDLVRGVGSSGSDRSDYRALAIALQLEDGSFADPVALPLPHLPSLVRAGDFNGDGLVDLVVLSLPPADSYPAPSQLLIADVLLGNGDGTFGEPRPVPTGNRRLLDLGHFEVGDVTGDGRSDLIQWIPDVIARNPSTGEVLSRSPAEVRVYPATGEGSLRAPVITVLPSNPTQSYASFTTPVIVDLNHDGRVDVIVPGQKFVVPTQILLSRGDGTFAARADEVIDDVFAMVAADFNGDGEIDLVSGDRFFRGLGGGAFARVPDSGLARAGVLPFGATGNFAADLDGDGRPELVARLTGTGGDVAVLGILTHGASGVFGLAGQVQAARSAVDAGALVADLNRDGRPDLIFSGGDGSTLPFFAYVLIQNPGGGFPAVSLAPDLAWLGFGELPLLADLNGDGAPDLVSYLRGPNPLAALGVVVSRDGGLGGLTTNQVGTTDPSFFIRALGTADFDEDGRLDVVVSKYNDTGISDAPAVYLMRGVGDGTLALGRLLSKVSSLLGVADFTGDGHADLLSYERLPNSGVGLAVWPGKGDGTFGDAITTLSVPNFFITGPVRLGDFNGDGRLDVVMSSSVQGGLGMWLNDGTGRFTLASRDSGVITRWEFLGVGDFNGDAKLDLLLNDRTRSIEQYRLVVVPGDGTGQLGAPLRSTPFPGVYNSKAWVADLNGDGLSDVVTQGRFPDELQEVRVSLGNGDGTFQAPMSFFGPGGGASTAISAADFNHDGTVDLLAGSSLLRQRVVPRGAGGTAPGPGVRTAGRLMRNVLP